MRYLLIALVLIACQKNEGVDTVNALDEANKKRDFYISLMDESVYLKRCDRLTFRAIADAFGKPSNIFDHEWSPGEWHRDGPEGGPCWPDESKSEISRDSFLGLFHALWTRQDHAALDRIRAYGTSSLWIMGEGPADLTSLAPLVPTLEFLRSRLSLSMMPRAYADADALPIFEGFQGHLLGLYIYLRGRVNGYIGPVEMSTLKELVAANPVSPFYRALEARFTDGDQAAALDILASDYPGDVLPMYDGVYGWGSCPASVYYLLTMGVINGS